MAEYVVVVAVSCPDCGTMALKGDCRCEHPAPRPMRRRPTVIPVQYQGAEARAVPVILQEAMV